jgi:hypothetical protein
MSVILRWLTKSDFAIHTDRCADRCGNGAEYVNRDCCGACQRTFTQQEIHYGQVIGHVIEQMHAIVDVHAVHVLCMMERRGRIDCCPICRSLIGEGGLLAVPFAV